MRYLDFRLLMAVACVAVPAAVAVPALSQTIEARRIPNAQFVRI
jgi:Tfp pilus assembly protein FimT